MYLFFFYQEICNHRLLVSTRIKIYRGFTLKDNHIVTYRRVRVTIMTGSSSDDWFYWHFGYNLS
jgi:hypothetical protein